MSLGKSGPETLEAWPGGTYLYVKPLNIGGERESS